MPYIPKGYTDIAAIEDYLLIDIEEDFESRVEEWIAMMEKFVDKKTGRNFISDAVASVRKYEVEKEQSQTVGEYTKTMKELFIDDCVEVTELKIDDVVVSVDDYLFYPAGELPISRIKIKDDVGEYFTIGEQNIEVKAKWGYSAECPSDISFATTIFVAGIINFSGDMEGEVKSESIGTYAVTFKDAKDWQDFERAKEILQQYRRINI